MASSAVPIFSLPTEVLIQILSPFPTRELLPLASVSRRFAGVVSRLHYSRLHEAALLEGHEMILEYYRPSLKISTPWLFCEYLGTDGLEAARERTRLRDMNALYTRFRPYLSYDRMRPSARFPTRRAAVGPVEGAEAVSSEQLTHEIYLEAGEHFSQLCVVANLVKTSPIKGLFLSISSVTDTWIRVRRDWLEEQALRPADDQGCARYLEDKSIRWVTDRNDVGLRFRVVKEDDPRTPVIMGADELPPATYVLHCEEILIRTNQLLLGLEVSLAQQVDPSGKAVMIVM